MDVKNIPQWILLFFDTFERDVSKTGFFIDFTVSNFAQSND
jgi:hypothetical protein